MRHAELQPACERGVAHWVCIRESEGGREGVREGVRERQRESDSYTESMNERIKEIDGD